MRLLIQSYMVVVRTPAIDEVVRDVSAPQLAILGAGLDDRAWRMQELSSVTVFEVDHPEQPPHRPSPLSGSHTRRGGIDPATAG